MILGPHQKEALACLHPLNTRYTDVFMASGAGPGKTTTGCIFLIEGAIDYPGSVAFIARKRLVDLQKTTLLSFIRLHKEYYGWFKYTIDNKYNVIKFANGSLIFLLDLAYSPQDPEYNRFGSYEFTRGFFDEVGECEERAVAILKSRVRFKLVNNTPKTFSASNPTGNWLRDTWIADRYRKPVVLEPHMKLITATLSQNPDTNYVATLSVNLSKLPLSDRKRLKDGDWFYLLNNDPWMTEFDYDKHVQHTQINRDYTLLSTHDFNWSPTTAMLMQLTNKGLFFHKEFSVTGGTQLLCQDIKPYIHNPGGFEITGDVSGNAKSSSQGLIGGDIATDFQIIKHELMLSDFQIKDTRKINPRLEHSRRLMNYLFRNFPVFIDPSCVTFIADLENAKCDDKGVLIKDRNENCNDLLDCGRYGVNYFFPEGTEQIERYKAQFRL